MLITKSLKVAELEDLPVLMDMAKKFYAESPYVEDFPLSLKKIEKGFQVFIVDRKKHIVLVSTDEDGQAVGMLVGQVIAPTFSDVQIAMELAWWLEPKYRKGRRGLELVNAFEKWGSLAGVAKVQMSRLSTSPDGIDSLFEKLGYSMVEKGYQKRL